jgi:hypothetical protein
MKACAASFVLTHLITLKLQLVWRAAVGQTAVKFKSHILPFVQYQVYLNLLSLGN